MERGTHICIPTNAKVWLITTLIITSFGFQPCPSYGDQHGAADKGEVSSTPLAAPLDLAVVDKLLTTTRTVRRRLDLTRPVEPEVIEEVIEIALQAPSGSNLQNWRFMVVTDPDKKKIVAELYRQSFESYAGPRPTGTPTTSGQRIAASAWHLSDHMHEVPVLIIGCIEGRPDRAEPGGASRFVRLDPAVGLVADVSPARPRTRLGLDHIAFGRRTQSRRSPRHPRLRHPGRPAAGRLLYGRRLQARETTVGERGDLLEYLGGRPIKPGKPLGVRMREAAPRLTCFHGGSSSQSRKAS